MVVKGDDNENSVEVLPSHLLGVRIFVCYGESVSLAGQRF
jgi:hypothetical protein